MNTHYDVIILGAGMVGATLANALAVNPALSIALLDRHIPIPLTEHDPPDLRVSALTRASEDLLTQLGIGSHFIPSRLSAFTDMQVWETPRDTLHFDCADIGEPRLGSIIENRHIQQACLAHCQQHANITCLIPAKPVSLSERTLQLEDGSILTASLIVAADGAHSQLRDWAGIPVHGWAYHQTAVVCTVQTSRPHQATAWQRFMPEGPLAFLPLSDPHTCSIVWSNSKPQAQCLLELDDQTFCHTLGQAFSHRLGDIQHVSSRAGFPLKLQHADQYVKTGFALVGDAAHTIHPLAGQGVNIGLLDAITLADVVLDAFAKHRDIGHVHTLKKYQRRRKADNLAMQLSMDAFKRIFGCDLGPVKWARRMGLQTVEQHQFLKNFFMHQASGYRFAYPKRLRSA